MSLLKLYFYFSVFVFPLYFGIAHQIQNDFFCNDIKMISLFDMKIENAFEEVINFNKDSVFNMSLN